MARGATVIGLAVAVVAALWAQASAQSSGCTPAIVSLSPCLGYITGNSSTPSPSCCSQLASVVQTQASCLCAVLNSSGAASLGLPINQTQALALPGACKVQTPPISQCNAAAASPAAAPAEAPATPSTPSVPSTPTPVTPSTPSVPSASSPTAPTTPSVPSGGSKTVPSTTSAGNSNRSSHSMAFAVIFLAACVSSLAGL